MLSSTNKTSLGIQCQTALLVVDCSLSLRCQCHICCQGANSHDDTVPRSLKETQLAPVQDGGCFKNRLSQGYCREWLEKIAYSITHISVTSTGHRALKVFSHQDPEESRNGARVAESITLNPLSEYLESCHANYPGIIIFLKSETIWKMNICSIS